MGAANAAEESESEEGQSWYRACVLSKSLSWTNKGPKKRPYSRAALWGENREKMEEGWGYTDPFRTKKRNGEADDMLPRTKCAHGSRCASGGGDVRQAAAAPLEDSDLVCAWLSPNDFLKKHELRLRLLKDALFAFRNIWVTRKSLSGVRQRRTRKLQFSLWAQLSWRAMGCRCSSRHAPHNSPRLYSLAGDSLEIVIPRHYIALHCSTTGHHHQWDQTPSAWFISTQGSLV